MGLTGVCVCVCVCVSMCVCVYVCVSIKCWYLRWDKAIPLLKPTKFLMICKLNLHLNQDLSRF